MVEWKERMEYILAPLTQEEMQRTAILFVIPAHRDVNYSLHDAVAQMTICNQSVIPISVVQPTDHVGQFWTSTLNGGVAYAAQYLDPKTSQASIIPISFETIVDDNNRDFLCYCIKNNQGFIGRRRMPNNIADIDTDFSAGTLIRNAACHYVMNNINPHDRLIQWTSCARNTLAWWPISVFREMGMFNPACGLIQGMEDWELILRAVIDSETTFAIPDMEFWYDDIRLTSLAERPSDDKDVIGQKTKLAGEIPTLRAIWQLLAVEFMNRNKGVATGEERMHRSPHEAEFELMSSYIEPKT